MQSRMGNAESDESGGHILSKRSIHEVITQVGRFGPGLDFLMSSNSLYECKILNNLEGTTLLLLFLWY